MDFLQKYLNQESIDFIKYCNTHKRKIGSKISQIELISKGNQVEIILKGKDIKDYFKTTEEDSSKYQGRILDGRLLIEPKQIKKHVSKKRLNNVVKII